MLVTFGSRVLASTAASDPYAQRYKGIWVCLTVLARALSGNYVNFGVFELYGDPAFKVPDSFAIPRPPVCTAVLDPARVHIDLASPSLALVVVVHYLQQSRDSEPGSNMLQQLN